MLIHMKVKQIQLSIMNVSKCIPWESTIGFVTFKHRDSPITCTFLK